MPPKPGSGRLSFWQRPAEPTGRLASCPSAGLGALNTSGALRRIHPFTYAIRPVGSAGLEVVRTFANPDHSVGESRMLTFGFSHSGRLLAVVHTERGRAMRVISARTAT